MVFLIKAVIFDLDGTLINSLQDLAEAVNESLKLHGFPAHEISEYRYFVGNGADELIKRTIPSESLNEKNQKDVSDNFNKFYAINYNKNTKPYDGIIDMLNELKKRNIFISSRIK